MTISRLLCMVLVITVMPVSQGVIFGQVRHTKDAFDPAKGEQLVIRFSINEPAHVSLLWYDDRELLVREQSSGSLLTKGEHKMTWDGLDIKGRLVPPEAYHYVLVAKSQSGDIQEFDLTDTRKPESLKVENVDYDAEDQLIRYRLAEKARVNIRFGLRDNGPLLRTVISWVARPAGDNAESWDGWDEDKVINLAKHPNLDIWMQAYRLSRNTIIVGEPAKVVSYIDDLPDPSRREVKRQYTKQMYSHGQQDAETRGDYQLDIKILGAELNEETGVYHIDSGRIPIRIDVAPEDRARAIERRLEPVFYIDGIFAFETEVGYLPMVWPWDSTTVAPGVHYITVNVRGYEGNFGIATIKVNLKNDVDNPADTSEKQDE